MESPGPSSASLSTVAVKENVGVPSSDQLLEDPRKVTYSSNLTFLRGIKGFRPNKLAVSVLS